MHGLRAICFTNFALGIECEVSNDYSFYFWVCINYFSLILSKVYCQMHLFCAEKLEEVIMVHHYDLFLLNSGCPYSTADRSKTAG